MFTETLWLKLRGASLSVLAGLKVSQSPKAAPQSDGLLASLRNCRYQPSALPACTGNDQICNSSLSVCQEIPPEELKQKREVMQDRSEPWLLFPSLLRQSLWSFSPSWFSKPTSFPPPPDREEWWKFSSDPTFLKCFWGLPARRGYSDMSICYTNRDLIWQRC